MLRSVLSLSMMMLASLGLSGGWCLTPQETVALADMANLETSLEMGYVDTGYLVSLEALDDVLNPTSNPPYNYLYNGGGVFALRPEKGRFESAPFNPLNGWLGPYASYQPGTTQTGTAPYDQGSPVDPWGNPYLFYSPLGLLRGDTGAFTQEYYGDQFDRYAIVSLGQDGIMSADDLIRLLGGGLSGVTQLAASSLSGPGVGHSDSPSGTVYTTRHENYVTIRGYNFGATQGSSKVFFNSTEITTIISWSNTSITFQLPTGVSGPGSITVRVGATSNALQLNVLPNAVADWSLYE